MSGNRHAETIRFNGPQLDALKLAASIEGVDVKEFCKVAALSRVHFVLTKEQKERNAIAAQSVQESRAQTVQSQAQEQPSPGSGSSGT